MYKILIVDDEMLIRSGIKNSINWSENGFEEPLQAYNGIEALEIINANNIDILITDIKMPDMDGLVLIERIVEMQKSIEVIILSCHNDFVYVKKALELHACEYLFKLDMLPEDIIKAINKAVARIKSKTEVNNRIVSLEKLVSDNVPRLKEVFILDMLNGKAISKEEFLAKSDQFGLSFGTSNISIILLKLNNITDIAMSRFNNDNYLFHSNVLDVLLKSQSQYGNCDVICKSPDEYISILSNTNEPSLRKIRDICVRSAREAVEALKTNLDLTATAGVSNGFHGFSSIQTAYEEACLAINNRLFDNFGSITLFEDVQKQTGEPNPGLGSLLEELKLIEPERLPEKIKYIFQRIRSSGAYSIKDAIELSSNIIGIMLKSAMLYDGVLEEVYSKEPDIYYKLHMLSSLAEFEAFISKIADEIGTALENKCRNEISEAVKYIERHLGDQDISLDRIARHINISRNYFSKLFKKLTGENFIDYLIRKRIEKARKLYMTTDMKIFQIAEAIGYPDWRYFCKVYKKHTGSSLSSLKR